MRVEDIMSKDVAVARPDMTLKEAARLLVDRGISGLPVVSAAGRVIGVVSEGDLLPRDGAPRRHRRALAWLLEHGDGAEVVEPARLVADVMSSPAFTVDSFWTIPGAAHLMRHQGVKRLPVLRAGELVGIVSRADIVRAFARSDAEVEREVRELVDFERALWSDQLSVDIEVKGGEVVLSGAVERRSLAETLPPMTGRIPGVVSVDSQLSWQDDDREPSRSGGLAG
jgi:CBS domain-containing protein